MSPHDVAQDLRHRAAYANLSYFGDELGVRYDTLGPFDRDPHFILVAVADNGARREFGVEVYEIPD
ncbi:hypothetical protein OG474_30625 [Kribbella sp. NBC_01505]|uniref:hypothetical protein n=1 Tax=Kribbella sp. NBC_01505 TaxID=2903580 RepID=UPI003863566A